VAAQHRRCSSANSSMSVNNPIATTATLLYRHCGHWTWRWHTATHAQYLCRKRCMKNRSVFQMLPMQTSPRRLLLFASTTSNALLAFRLSLQTTQPPVLQGTIPTAVPQKTAALAHQQKQTTKSDRKATAARRKQSYVCAIVVLT
jgi:hypothetical protein